MYHRRTISMSYIDLHVHSTASDGTYTPAQLVEYACQKGLCAFALTDHDTVAGIAEAVNAAKNMPVKVIPGVELACPYNGSEIHILGYNFDYRNKELLSALDRIKDARADRNDKMCGLLRKHGMNITYEELKERFHSENISRGNFATLLTEKGYVKDRAEAFEKYLGEKCCCYIPRYRMSTDRAAALIKRAGGVLSLAHPVMYHMSDEQYDILLDELKALGITRVEAIYSRNSFDDDIKFRELAKRHGFLITGGSDFHGSVKPDIDLGTGCGNLMIPEELLKNIQRP